ncbi:endonuclease/exonuclease/phosphatase family protein [bacterium]|nr:endonuclease/exonuclease/phosphatase family protein [bacterium]
MRKLSSLFLFLSLSLAVSARPLQVMFWNLESPGHDVHEGEKKTADLDFLCQRIHQDFGAADLVGFAEVEPDWGPALEKALETASGTDWELRLSPTGGHDRLAVAWRSDRYNLLECEIIPELGGPFRINAKELNFRPSLYARLRPSSDEGPITFVVNHLARSNAENGPPVRRKQANLLRQWLAHIQDPVVCVGDFNFDYHIRQGDKDNSGFSVLTREDLYHWVRYPDPLVPTEGESKNGTPIFPYESILDFIFVANQAREWKANSQVLTRPDDFSPEDQNSDHRPVRANFEIHTSLPRNFPNNPNGGH